jgi:hypothetical protein
VPVRHKDMKKMASVLGLVALVAGSAGIAAAAPAHGGHGAPAFHGAPHAGAPHVGRPAFHGGARGFHGHPGFHRGFHGRAFVGVAPFFVDPFPVFVAPPVVDAPPVYTQPAPSSYWYYCPSAGAYYPYVSSCAEPWVPVPPTGG